MEEPSEIGAEPFPELHLPVHSSLLAVVSQEDFLTESGGLKFSAFNLLKLKLSQIFSDTRFIPEEHLLFACHVSQEISQRMQREIVDVEQVEEVIAFYQVKRDSGVLLRTSAPSMQWSAVMAWLKHRANFELSSEVLVKTMNLFLRKIVTAEQWSGEIQKKIDAIWRQHHWLLRHFLAARIYFSPDAFTLKYPWMGIVIAVQALGILRAFTFALLEEGETDDYRLAHATIDAVEHCQLHNLQIESGMKKALVAQKVQPQSLLQLIYV